MTLSRLPGALGALFVLAAAPAAAREPAFDHVGTFNVPANLRAGEPIDTVTSAEIVAAADDGRTLIYTDSPSGRIGFVDIRRPSAPAAGGAIDMGGEPTSVATVGDLAARRGQHEPELRRAERRPRRRAHAASRGSSARSRSPASPTRSRSRPTSATPRS